MRNMELRNEKNEECAHANQFNFILCVRTPHIHETAFTNDSLEILADAKKEAEIDDRYEIEIVHESTN